MYLALHYPQMIAVIFVEPKNLLAFQSWQAHEWKHHRVQLLRLQTWGWLGGAGFGWFSGHNRYNHQETHISAAH